jgi:hypothetical protein
MIVPEVIGYLQPIGLQGEAAMFSDRGFFFRLK